MKLFYVTNGYIGDGYVSCMVIAETEADARPMAREAFYRKAHERGVHANEPQFWERLELSEWCADTSQPWAGEVDD